jgi:hypothetical protein
MEFKKIEQVLPKKIGEKGKDRARVPWTGARIRK